MPSVANSDTQYASRRTNANDFAESFWNLGAAFDRVAKDDPELLQPDRAESIANPAEDSRSRGDRLLNRGNGQVDWFDRVHPLVSYAAGSRLLGGERLTQASIAIARICVCVCVPGLVRQQGVDPSRNRQLAVQAAARAFYDGAERRRGPRHVRATALVPYYTLTHFHQFPFWDPYKCGGMTMLGNPESSIVTPFLLLYLIFGLIPGMLLEIYLHVAIMFAGGYIFGRELGLVPLAALVLAAFFPSSSWLSLHIAMGHLNFLSVAYIPWTLALLLASCRLHRWHLAMLGGLLCG